jgi:hypothetical protein
MSIDPIKEAGRKARGKRPLFFEDQQAERVLNITMALAQELAVTRERLDTLERILASKGQVNRSDIEQWQPNDEEARERQLWQQDFIARILRIVQQEREGIKEAAGGQPDTDTIISKLNQ